jgi:CO/xanthine dehydrogenase Mo-binding subunit
VAEVAVDRDTGDMTVRRCIGCHDLGTVLNEIGLTGQLAGGLIQGLGLATMEELRVSNGRVETVGLNDYKLPTMQDLPPFDELLITEAPGNGPRGAKPDGELTNMLLPPAIANAVYDAVGGRIDCLPITAEKVYRALRVKGEA